MTRDELEALAHETANAARRAKRLAFQVRWGYFWKCAVCGARLGPCNRPPCFCTDPTHRTEPRECRYTPPPSEEKP